ncbi:tyrosine-type recombinase/integrase [Klebsiella quasipneumoniae]|uniref:tyrosine-type recombinase/integrase n=1 Tax=Klebsiella quasipneumoniae TaxID=1463165 RepID=UPI00352BBD94
MSVKPLTASVVKSARARDKDYSLHDGFGLLLYVSKAGGRSWRFRYAHPFTGKRQTYTIGRYPEFSLVEAREERDKLRRLIARDIDPASHRESIRREAKEKHLQTFGAIANDWLVFKKSGSLRASTINTIEFFVTTHIIPSFGCMNINEMTAPSVISILQKFNDRPAILARLISKLNEIMSYCVNIGIIKVNPLSKIKKAFAVKKDTPLNALTIERLPDFLAWWETRESLAMRCSLMFQILTMVRPREAREARWVEVDLKNKIWTIPPERMKSGREHIVPLSTQALKVIQCMAEVRYGDFIFYSPKKPNQAISRALRHKYFMEGPFLGEATAHGFRSMWSTLLNEEGFNPDVIEAALAHKNADAIRGIYNRTSYFEQRRIMMQWIGDFVDDARNGIIKRSGGHQGLRIVND